MIASFLLALREGLEAALLVSLTLGVLQKMNRPQFAPAVWAGVGVAIGLSAGAALILHQVGAKLEGPAEPIFEGVLMFLASGVLTWMIFWMARQGRAVQAALQSEVETAVLSGGQWGLFAIAFFAVLREGIETALFLTAAAFASSSSSALIGGLSGLLLATILGWLLFTATVRLNVRQFFQITSVLLILFAAGLVAHGVHEFNEVGWIPGIIEHVWDMNHILSDKSTIGLLLTALFGYNGDPSLTEVLAYVGYFAAIWGGLYLGRQTQRQPNLEMLPQ